MHAHYAIAHAHADARNGDEEEKKKEGRKEDVGGQDGRRNGAAAVQSSTGKSVGPPQRRPSPLLIPTAVLRLYLVPPSSSCPSSPCPFSPRFSPRSLFPGCAAASFSFSPSASRASPGCFSLFLSLRFCRALARLGPANNDSARSFSNTLSLLRAIAMMPRDRGALGVLCERLSRKPAQNRRSVRLSNYDGVCRQTSTSSSVPSVRETVSPFS